MLLGQYYDAMEIHRGDKIVWVKFLSPHRVISTCGVNGGIREDLEGVYNHQSCEPNGHSGQMEKIMAMDPRDYMTHVCSGIDLHQDLSASLGTAANMHNVAIIHEEFRGLEVVAVCTGGVETNAGRAGDPADYFESEGQFIKLTKQAVAEKAGTINIMVFINLELTQSALVRSIVTATEAKTAVLQELAVGSKYSDGLATGTGTDQISVSCLLRAGVPLKWSGKHNKLGELIGTTVHAGVRETLERQNGLFPGRQCSTVVHLERFGTDRESLRRSLMDLFPEQHADLLSKNFDVLDRDPVTVAAVAALTHMRDKLGWGVLPHGCRQEILVSFGAQVAAAVSGKYDKIVCYRDKLSGNLSGDDNKAFLKLVCKSLALGFEDKWE